MLVYCALVFSVSANDAKMRKGWVENQSSLASELLDAEHVKLNIKAWRKWLLAQDLHSNCDCTQQYKNKIDASWHEAVKRVVIVESLYSEFHEQYAANFSIGQLKKMVQWWHYPLGRKIAKGLQNDLLRQIKSSDIELQFDASTILQSLKHNQLRKKAIEEINKIYGWEKLHLTVLKSMYYYFWLGSVEQTPNGKPSYDSEQYMTEIDKSLAAWRPLLSEGILASEAMVYQGLSIWELYQLKNYISQPLAKGMQTKKFEIWEQLLNETMKQVGKEYSRSFYSTKM